MKITKKFWIWMAVLIVLSPLGLILPEHFKAGAAWGEWGISEMQKLIGYVPDGLEKLSSLWNAPIPGYAFKGWEEKDLCRLGFAYIIAAIVGISLIVLLVMIIGKWLAKKE